VKSRHNQGSLVSPVSHLGPVAVSALALCATACSNAPDAADVDTATSGQALASAIAPTALTTSKSVVVSTKSGAGRAFSVTLPSGGSYHIRAWALGVRQSGALTVFLDNEERPIGSITTRDSGWRTYDVTASNGTATIALPAGTHQLVFRSGGDRVPEVENVQLSKDGFSASAADQNYANYIANLKTRALPYDHAATKRAELSRALSPASSVASDNYCYSLNASLTYTYKELFSFSANQTVTFETKNSNVYGSDPVMYLVSLDNPQSLSWANDDSNGYQSRISVTIPSNGAGMYWLLVRAYNPNSPGTSDLWKDNALYASNIPLAGNRLYCDLNKANLWLNYFTAYNGTDTMLWLVDQGNGFPGQISAHNDDYFQPGDFNWGQASRIHRSPISNPLSYAIFNAYSSYAVATTTDVYLENEDSDIMSYFENLKAIDAIQSAPEDGDYNCISWSGGVTTWWEWPLNYGDPWFNADPLTAFDNWYGNTPKRFTGAYTYTRSGVDDSNAMVDLWAHGTSPSNYSFTHGSVRKGGDGNPHGYDWESKPGGLTRTFHPRRALNGNSYGDVVYSYRWTGNTASSVALATSGGNQPTLQDAVRAGLVVVESPTLSTVESSKLQSLKAAVSADATRRFETLYSAWKTTWGQPGNAAHSDPSQYGKSREYAALLAYCKQLGTASWALLFDKYIAGDRLVLVAIEDVALPSHASELSAIRSESARERYTNDGKYIVPSLEANITKFVQRLLTSL
jgi:hypothetical protein